MPSSTPGLQAGIQLRLRSKVHEAVLTVSDTGVGIAPEDLPRVFDRFYPVPGSDARSRGTGLGLAIARRIVEAHGGSVTVESRVSHGSTFTVRFPLSR